MSIDHDVRSDTANDPTLVHPTAVPQQFRYEPPAGLGPAPATPGYGPVFPGPPLPAPPAGGRRRTGLIITIVAVLFLAIAGVGAFLLLASRTVDPATVQKEIIRVTEQTDKVTPTGVQCPSDVLMEKGRTFTCAATLVNKPVTYAITLVDDQGGVTITYPRPFLDPASVTREIERTSRSQMHVAPTNVQCPADVRIEKGVTFDCAASLEGQALNYKITETDDRGALSIDHERVVPAGEVEAELARELTQAVGEKVVATCAKDGQTMIVNAVGQPITCHAANAADPSRNAPVTVQIDATGGLTYQF